MYRFTHDVHLFQYMKDSLDANVSTQEMSTKDPDIDLDLDLRYDRYKLYIRSRSVMMPLCKPEVVKVPNTAVGKTFFIL